VTVGEATETASGSPEAVRVSNHVFRLAGTLPMGG
jgi:hypothetical protein